MSAYSRQGTKPWWFVARQEQAGVILKTTVAKIISPERFIYVAGARIDASACHLSRANRLAGSRYLLLFDLVYWFNYLLF